MSQKECLEALGVCSLGKSRLWKKPDFFFQISVGLIGARDETFTQGMMEELLVTRYEGEIFKLSEFSKDGIAD